MLFFLPCFFSSLFAACYLTVCLCLVCHLNIHGLFEQVYRNLRLINEMHTTITLWLLCSFCLLTRYTFHIHKYKVTMYTLDSIV